MEPLLRNNPAEGHDIVILPKAPSLRDLLRLHPLRPCYAVRNKMRFSSVPLKEVLLKILGQNNDLIGVPRRHLLSGLKHAGGKMPPFCPLPVESVNRGNHADPEKLRQPAHQARALRMKMNHIVTAEQCPDRCEK